jgi:hypothetical protein
VDSVWTYLSLQEKNYYIKILKKYGVNIPAPCRGRGHKAARVAALVEVPCLPNSCVLPVCQHCQQFAGGVWAVWVVGGMSVGVQPRLVVLPPSLGWGQRGGAVSFPCVVGWLLHWGCIAREWAWGTVGTCIGWAWLVHGCGEVLQITLHGVGLAGAVGIGVAWPCLGTLR